LGLFKYKNKIGLVIASFYVYIYYVHTKFHITFQQKPDKLFNVE